MKAYGRKNVFRHRGKNSAHRDCPICHQHGICKKYERRIAKEECQKWLLERIANP